MLRLHFLPRVRLPALLFSPLLSSAAYFAKSLSTVATGGEWFEVRHTPAEDEAQAVAVTAS